MAIRLLVILGFLLQPMLLGAGPLACRPATPGPTGCCQVTDRCCDDQPAVVHHCGRPAVLCQCGREVPEQPRQPAPQTRTADTLAAILPRVLTAISLLPEAPRRHAHALPAAQHPAGQELRAYLCIWLT
jgi:hypothetical protein